MGMPITLEIIDEDVTAGAFQKIYDYFKYVDEKFSTYKSTSEISKINRGELDLAAASEDMQEIFRLADQTKKQTFGYFDIRHNGKYDPSGIVKGWAILQAYRILIESGFKHFYLDVGGDIQVAGQNSDGKSWQVGIRHPFEKDKIVKVLSIDNRGVATSGSYLRGDHIYDPLGGKPLNDIVSLTVVGPDVYEADRFATAAFAMGKKGIEFIEKLPGFEAYQIDNQGIATLTSGFRNYIAAL